MKKAPSACCPHDWVRTTADDWRRCTLCHTVQRLVNGQWIIVTPSPSTPKPQPVQPSFWNL